MQNDKTTIRLRGMVSRLGALAILTAAFAGTGCLGTDEAEAPTDTPRATGDTSTVQSAIFFTTQTEYDDTGQTVCKGMHCCGNGYAVTGISIPANVLRCAWIWNSNNPPTPPNPNAMGCTVESTGLFRDTTRACPAGRYILGVDVPGNRLTCCPYPSYNQPTTLALDGNSSSVFLTETHQWDPPEAPHYEYLNGQRWLHACPSYNGVRAVMEGLNGGADDLLCSR